MNTITYPIPYQQTDITINENVLPTTYQQTDITINENILPINNKSIKKAVDLWFINQDQCIQRYGPISEWNTSEVKNMSELFSLKRLDSVDGIKFPAKIKQFISIYDELLDRETIYLNENEQQEIDQIIADINNIIELDLNSWDTSNVTNMREMFYLQINLNPILSNWKTSNVKSMSKMFCGATNFNQDLSNWDTSEITNMSYMFFNAKEFNNNATNLRFIVHENTKTDYVFHNSNLQTIVRHNVLETHYQQSEETDRIILIQNKLSNGEELTSEDDKFINDYTQAALIKKEFIFDNNTLRKYVKKWIGGKKRQRLIREKGHISRWNISRVTSLENLFLGNTEFNEDISRWNTYKVKNMNGTFYEAANFNQNIRTNEINSGQYNQYTAWDVSKVTTADCMFGYSGFNQDISNWNIQNIKEKTNILDLAFNLDDKNILFENIRSPNVDEDGDPINSKIYLNNETIRDAVNLWYNDPNHDRFTNRDNENYIGPIEEWEVELVTDMSYLFSNAPDNILNKIPAIQSWDVSSVRNMTYLFYNFENNESNRQKLKEIFEGEEVDNNFALTNLKYAHNLINREHFIDLTIDTYTPLFTEISKIGAKISDRSKLQLDRDLIFDIPYEPLEDSVPYTVYKMYDYDEPQKQNKIIYFWKNLERNFNDNTDPNDLFYDNLNTVLRIETQFHEGVGADFFAETQDIGGITKALLFEPFARHLYYDAKIINSAITCERTRDENARKQMYCPFILEDNMLKINPHLKVDAEVDSISEIFGTVENFYSRVGLILQKLITIIIKDAQDINGYDEYYKAYIPFDKLFASLITGEIRLNDNMSFDETNNILNLIDHLENVEDVLEDINNKIFNENTPVNDDNILENIDLNSKLAFNEIDSLEKRSLVIRQKLNLFKYGSQLQNATSAQQQQGTNATDNIQVADDNDLPYGGNLALAIQAQDREAITMLMDMRNRGVGNVRERDNNTIDVTDQYPNVDFKKIYLGKDEKELIISNYLCYSNPELFQRFKAFYISIFYYRTDIKFIDTIADEADEIDYEIHEGLNYDEKTTSRMLIDEFICPIDDDRLKFLGLIDSKIEELREVYADANVIAKLNRLQMFKELVQNKDDEYYIENEDLVKLFVWFSGSRCFPETRVITLQGTNQGDPRSILFRTQTCFNELIIPTHDYSKGYNYENMITGQKMAFPTNVEGENLKYNYNKQKLKEILIISIDGSG